MSLLDKALKKIEESKKVQETKKNIPGEKKLAAVIKSITSKPKKAKHKVSTKREFNKDQLTERILIFLKENKEDIPIEKFRSMELELRIISER